MNQFFDLISELGFTKESYALRFGKSMNTMHRRTSTGPSHYAAPKEVMVLLLMLKEVKSAEIQHKSNQGQVR